MPSVPYNIAKGQAGQRLHKDICNVFFEMDVMKLENESYFGVVTLVCDFRYENVIFDSVPSV